MRAKYDTVYGDEFSDLGFLSVQKTSKMPGEAYNLLHAPNLASHNPQEGIYCCI